MLDLSKTNLSTISEEGYTFEIIIPEVNTPTGAFLTVRGEQSKTVKDFGRKQFETMQAKAKAAKRRGKEADDISLAEAEEMAVESAYVRLMGWENIEEEGKAVKFTEENAKRVLKEHSWLRDLIIENSQFLGNFVK